MKSANCWVSMGRTGQIAELALGRIKNASGLHGSMWSPVGVVFYISDGTSPRSTVYCSTDYSSIFPKWVGNDFECLQCHQYTKKFHRPKSYEHLCCNIRQLLSTGIQFGTTFYFQSQKSALNGTNRCEPGATLVRITTECAVNEFKRERTTLVSMVRSRRSSDPVRPMETQRFLLVP